MEIKLRSSFYLDFIIKFQLFCHILYRDFAVIFRSYQKVVIPKLFLDTRFKFFFYH